MSRIRGKNTKPEKEMFSALRQAGIKFEKHYKLLGNPDIVFPNEKLAVFVDGDFWHGLYFQQRRGSLPEYWVKKITRNIKRDRKYTKELEKSGWLVIRLWEAEVLKDTGKCIKKIQKKLRSLHKLIERTRSGSYVHHP